MSIPHLFAFERTVFVSYDTHVTRTKSHLAGMIEEAAHAAIHRLELDPNYFMGTVYPRNRSRFSWLAENVPAWRLGTIEPLWLGIDRVVYEGHDIEVWDDYEYPSYLQALDLTQSDIPSLMALLAAIDELTGT